MQAAILGNLEVFGFRKRDGKGRRTRPVHANLHLREMGEGEEEEEELKVVEIGPLARNRLCNRGIDGGGWVNNIRKNPLP